MKSSTRAVQLQQDYAIEVKRCEQEGEKKKRNRSIRFTSARSLWLILIKYSPQTMRLVIVSTNRKTSTERNMKQEMKGNTNRIACGILADYSAVSTPILTAKWLHQPCIWLWHSSLDIVKHRGMVCSEPTAQTALQSQVLFRRNYCCHSSSCFGFHSASPFNRFIIEWHANYNEGREKMCHFPIELSIELLEVGSYFHQICLQIRHDIELFSIIDKCGFYKNIRKNYNRYHQMKVMARWMRSTLCMSIAEDFRCKAKRLTARQYWE